MTAPPDRKWPVGLYAPGTYWCRCAKCGQSHLADKRAQHCADCTIQDLVAANAAAKDMLLKLSDSNAVHLNILRGTIAKPSLVQIAHIYGGARAGRAGRADDGKETMMDDLVRRLRGEYRIPITDGLGPAGGEEPENAREFVRKFETPPIQHEAAARLAALEATNAELTAWNTGQSDRILALEAEVARLQSEQDQLLADSAIRSDQREIYEKLCGRLSVGKASQQEAIDAITALCRDNERLALIARKARAALEAGQ